MSLLYENEKYLLELENDFLTFEKLDLIFYKIFPKDIVKHIYNYVKPICDNCENCCNVCKVYCYFQCLREMSGRDVCNKTEFNNTFSRYYRDEIENKDNEENENKS